MKKILKIIPVLLVLLVGFIYYYIALPAINLHSPGLWSFIITILLIVTAGAFAFLNKYKKLYKLLLLVSLASIFIFIIGGILSSPIINAKKYRNLCSVSERNFTEDIDQISYNEIPVLDRDSAINLGSRKMGSMVDMVSQFEVNELYSQVNYKEKPTRVTPLDYGNIIKWFINRKDGIPAYISIDMTTQEVECVKLEKGIKYSFSEPLNRNVTRYLRFHYPTYIFDSINFEIDDNGIPYWICPVRDYTIGLFGGIKIQKAVLLNAITGELTEYDINDVPNWVDKVYSADLLISYYNYYGTLKNGYLNSIIGQKGCLQTTDGYNYIALDDDVWVYTGVTSVGGDKSNVGFVLMNQRTAETRYYSIPGAEENSAMSSAEGQVQNLGYKATFPLLLNIANEPTYFISLKDNAGLVKCYAMVNIERYQIVAIGNSLQQCEENYRNLLKTNGVDVETEVKAEENSPQAQTVQGKVVSNKEVIIDGNTHYFLTLDTSSELYDINIKDNIYALGIDFSAPVTIQFEKTDNNYNKVINIKN